MLVTLILCVIISLFSQTTGKIKGYVKSEEGNPLLAVTNVCVVGTTYGAEVDSNGYYWIIGVKEGRYQLKCINSFSHYSQVKSEFIEVKRGQTNVVDFILNKDNMGLKWHIVHNKELQYILDEIESLDYYDQKAFLKEDRANPGTISGHVTDENKKPLNHVKITLPGFRVFTNDKGEYLIRTLYNIEGNVLFELEGYKPAVLEKVELKFGKTYKKDVILEPNSIKR